MPLDINAVKEKLKTNEYKLTPQREVILRAVNASGEHLSAEEVYTLVKKSNPEIGLATVYRTLDLLSELEILHKIDFGDGKGRFEMSRGDLHHHHHLICVKCGLVREFGEDLLDDLERVIAEKNHFKVLDHQLKVYGLCQECQPNPAAE